MKKDMLEKKLFDHNDVFAEVFNEIVFEGTGVRIDPDDLEDARARSVYVPLSDEDNPVREQERDVAKFWKKGGVVLCLMGIEGQTKIDNFMPLRVMGYEGADYRYQVIERDEAVRSARLKGDIEGAKQIRARKCYPVITAVLYFGINKIWDKNISLHECLEMSPGFENVVEDRHINVINLAWLSDEQEGRLKTDLRLLVGALKQKRITGTYKPKDNREIKHVEDVIRLLQELTGMKNLFYEMLLKYPATKHEGGNVDMIDLFGDAIAEGRAEGITEGIAKVLEAMRKRGYSEEDIAKLEADVGVQKPVVL